MIALFKLPDKYTASGQSTAYTPQLDQMASFCFTGTPQTLLSAAFVEMKADCIYNVRPPSYKLV